MRSREARRVGQTRRPRNQPAQYRTMSAEAFKIPRAIDVCQMLQGTHREGYDDHADSEVAQGAAVRCKPQTSKGCYPSGYEEDAEEPKEA